MSKMGESLNNSYNSAGVVRGWSFHCESASSARCRKSTDTHVTNEENPWCIIGRNVFVLGVSLGHGLGSFRDGLLCLREGLRQPPSPGTWWNLEK